MHLTVCYYYIMYVFQSESKLYFYLNIKELLARNRRNIFSFCDCKKTRTQNHLFRKKTLSHLAKLTKLIELSCDYLSVQCN